MKEGFVFAIGSFFFFTIIATLHDFGASIMRKTFGGFVMKRILAAISRFILVTLFGITQTSCVMYGSPSADYQFKGKVMDEGSLPIKDIRVTVKEMPENESSFILETTTDASGNFKFEEKVFVFDFPEKLKVVFEDTDGPDNRGEYLKDSLIIGSHQVEKADGWYAGGYVSDDIDVYLKRNEL